MCYDTQKSGEDVCFMFGIRLCYLRCKAGLTQIELGRRLNLSGSALGMYEQGRRSPSISIIIAISEEFHVSTHFLLTGEGITEYEKSLEAAIEQYITICEHTPLTNNYLVQHHCHNAMVRRLISQEH